MFMHLFSDIYSLAKVHFKLHLLSLLHYQRYTVQIIVKILVSTFFSNRQSVNLIIIFKTIAYHNYMHESSFNKYHLYSVIPFIQTVFINIQVANHF